MRPSHPSEAAQGTKPRPAASARLVVTGLGSCVPACRAPGARGEPDGGRSKENGGASRPSSDAPLDPTPWLRERKMRKFMGKQDALAVVAAGRAAREAGLDPALLRGAGLYMAVGYIPFERSDIEPLARASSEGGRFSMARFSAEGYPSANPLLTFRCLPNMPIFHVSLNLGIQGPYSIGYPGPGQLYLALEEAARALGRGEARVALVGGAADQDNFLVAHHFRRTPRAAGLEPADAAGFLVLETEEAARSRGARPLWRLSTVEVGYDPDGAPFAEALGPAREGAGVPGSGGTPYLGPGSLPILLDRSRGRDACHELTALDGIRGRSVWRAVDQDLRNGVPAGAAPEALAGAGVITGAGSLSGAATGGRS